MEKYTPLITVTLAFIAAVISYINYVDYQYVKAESRNEIQQEELNNSESRLLSVEAKHILVKSFEEAEKIRNRISKGEEFEKIAREVSLCPSGKFGGDLGVIKKGQMVKEFEDIAFSTPKGGISSPVKTEFGWHLIKVTDRVYIEVQ